MLYQTRAIIVPQISEFSAITVANELRRFSANIKLGLSEDINPFISEFSSSKGMLNTKNYLSPESIR